MNDNYSIKMENILGDYYLCLGAFNNCITLYNERDKFIINDDDSDDIKRIKQSQMLDLMSNLGKVGEKALKYIIALQKVKIAPNEDLRSLEAVFRGDNAIKNFARQLGYDIDNIQEIFDYKDYNNQKAHNFDYLFLIIEKLIPLQSSKIENYILYDIQSRLIKDAIDKGIIDNSFSFIRAIMFPKFVITCGFTDEEELVVPNNRSVNKKDYEVYRNIIKESGDIFTRLRYYSNNPKDRDFNLEYIFKVIGYFVEYIKIIHENGDNLDFDLDEYFARKHVLNNLDLLCVSSECANDILNLNISLNVREKILFQYKECAEFGCSIYPLEMIVNLIKLNLSEEDILEIIDFNLSSKFVEYCLLNGVKDFQDMYSLYEQYVAGEDVSILIKKRNKNI